MISFSFSSSFVSFVNGELISFFGEWKRALGFRE